MRTSTCDASPPMMSAELESVVPLQEIVPRVADLLPAQGPLDLFVHHNTLHHFEDRPFERAVAEAGALFGCEPYMDERWYRARWNAGEISDDVARRVLQAELAERDEEDVVPGLRRDALWWALLKYGIEELRGQALRWTLAESDALRRFRRDTPATQPWRSRSECSLVMGLWEASLEAARRVAAAAAPSNRGLDPGGEPPNRLHRAVAPLLIRFTAAFLDQGIASWVLPRRERGMLRCFIDLYGRRAGWVESWGAALAQLIDDERHADLDGLQSLHMSLRAWPVADEDREAFLTNQALALRGWAGMVRQVEQHPERVPHPVPARLADYLAIRLLLLRAARAHDAVDSIADPQASDHRPDDPQLVTAWQLFQVAQLSGLSAMDLERWSDADIAAVLAETKACDAVTRRRLLHTAWEHDQRTRWLAAVTQNETPQAAGRADLQVIMCIDDREESFRRHLEEQFDGVETFGLAGYFGVAMFYQGLTDAHPRPLCPGSIVPETYVFERTVVARDTGRGQRTNRILANLEHQVHHGRDSLVRGSIVMPLVGLFAIVPLVLKVVFPWLDRSGRTRRHSADEQTELVLHREDVAPPRGRVTGFTTDQMIEIVATQLRTIGLIENFAPLVLVLGHGSTSLNNPHEAAHDCGACGGGRGGPNARAFAAMANDPDVRAGLARQGIQIPEQTWFVGGLRNTCSNTVELYDTWRCPQEVRAELTHVQAKIERVCALEAHERSRKFETVAPQLPPRLAWLHVRGRANDLAQPRPEYGHATNAFCIVGPRRFSRGLFLDRRAFLVSYEPDIDADGKVLAALLESVGPVVAGINLEYYFSYVDPQRYGAGTKLPHNVSGLIGVMDGARSDLRTGLPWQMTEIHEPLRLTMLVYAPDDRVRGIVERSPQLHRLVANRWLHLCTCHPYGRSLNDWSGFSTLVRERAQTIVPRISGHSSDYYGGRRDPLPVAIIAPVRGQR